MSNFINEAEIRKTLSILKGDGNLFEIRILKGKKTISGYFKDAETAVTALSKLNLRGTNVYLTLNDINEGCYSRQQRDQFLESVPTTSDSDIVGYQWMLIDLDPVRPAGVSSSNEELALAKELASKVCAYLRGLGFEEPVKAKSGNGYHILCRISLQNTSENAELLRRCLEVLSAMFSTDRVKIDTVNYNPSRICKLHGTLAQKGINSEDRPHRMSRILAGDNVQITKKIYLDKLAEQLPTAAPKAKSNYLSSYDRKSEFDLEAFLANNNLTYKQLASSGRDNSTIYALDECPFNHNHRDGDAKIFKYPDGAISFRCHHNSCSRYKWQDVRLLFEPSAYDKPEIDNRYDEGWKQHNRNKTDKEVCYEPQKTVDYSQMFRTAEEIYNDPEPNHEYILSGINEIDTKMHGLQKQAVSLISGLRASGKSTLMGNIILKAVEDGHTVVVYSGELSNKKYLNWIFRQAAGKNNVEVSTSIQNGVGVSAENSRKIYKWMSDRFWLYNNNYGNNFKEISAALRRILKKKKADLCIIDNLMALDLVGLDRTDKYEAQTKFMWELKEIAELTNTHMIVVAHPKKASGLIRLEDVSGSGNITNIIDNAFMVHRVNMDFEKRFNETFAEDWRKRMNVKSKDPKPGEENKIEEPTNVIEIAKDREDGTMDYFIPLYFEPVSKRLKNSPAEYIHYGWEDDNYISMSEFEELDDEEDIPFV